MNELVLILTEFGGGKGGAPNGEVVRFLLAAFFWAMLFFIAGREWQRDNKQRDLYVGLAAVIGLCRELLMFTAEYGSSRGLISFDFMYLYYPPLEHAATMLSCIVIAFAFLQQVRVNSRFTTWFLRIAITVTLAIYLITAIDWQRFLAAHPGSSFGMYGGDMAFRVAASIFMATALAAFMNAKRSGKFVPFLLLAGFAFFFLDEFLMILNLATDERYVAVFAPVRHNLHIWAIPLLAGTYWAELRQRIRETGNFAYAVIDALSAHICVLDGDGKIIAVNRTWRETDIVGASFGVSMQEGSNYLEICEQTAGKLNEQAATVAAGIRMVMQGTRKEFSHKYPVIGPQDTRWFMAQVTCFTNQDTTYAVISHEDITERKLSKEALRASEERYRQLYDSMEQGMALLEMACDENGQHKDCRFLEVNPSYERIVGLSKEQIIGRTVLELFPGLEDYWIETYCRVAMTGEATTYENYAQPLDRYYQVYAYCPRIGQLAVLVNDITGRRRSEEERRRLEEQMQHAQKLESLGVLAGGIAHDFNNILMAILGHAELAMMKLNPAAPARDNLLKIEQSAQRAAELSRQMLAYSGKGKFVVEAINLGDLVTEMAHMLEVSISKKAILRLNLAADLPPVEADATQLRQVLMNLVINASEAIGDKSGVIAISTGAMQCDLAYLSQTWINEKLAAGLYVYVEVADTGCGMDKETLGKIFDPFFTTKFTGRGLGMAAVMGIVRGHHGAIKTYSEPGRGTTFKLLLPAAITRAGGLQRIVAAKQLWHGSGTILLADDEETIRALGCEMLEMLGFQVLTAADGRQAVEIFQERQGEISCVVLDLTMPHMDGEEAFRELRRIKEDVRVIMSSGYNEQEVNQRFLGKQLAGFIQKPYKMDELSTVLRRALEP